MGGGGGVGSGGGGGGGENVNVNVTDMFGSLSILVLCLGWNVQLIA